jgi:hypothetical protein
LTPKAFFFQPSTKMNQSKRKQNMARIALGVKSVLLAVLLMTMAAGCGASAKDRFAGKRGEVSGTITYDAKPLLKGCQVIFMAAEGGYTASGAVQDNGQYTLVYTGGPGIPEGKYLVQLTAPIAPDSGTTVDPVQMASKMNVNPALGGADTGPFPKIYESTTTSKLEFNVAEGKNTADFKLEKPQ